MKDIDELEDYIEKTEDMQLGMILSIVKEYGEKIPELIRQIKDRHVGDTEREKAELIFSTVHRSKGMEYDTVRLVNDFITEDKLKKLAENSASEFHDASTAKLNEEINLLYVAATRAKNTLYIPTDLLPVAAVDAVEYSEHICKMDFDEEWYNVISPPEKPKYKDKNDKIYTVEEARKKYANAYKPWTPELDGELTAMYREDAGIKEMAKHFGRNRSSILSRIKKLELEELYG
jgi:ATP-dependent exoDNAse (exonuclease V) beta subunit